MLQGNIGEWYYRGIYPQICAAAQIMQWRHIDNYELLPRGVYSGSAVLQMGQCWRYRPG